MIICPTAKKAASWYVPTIPHPCWNTGPLALVLSKWWQGAKLLHSLQWRPLILRVTPHWPLLYEASPEAALFSRRGNSGCTRNRWSNGKTWQNQSLTSLPDSKHLAVFISASFFPLPEGIKFLTCFSSGDRVKTRKKKTENVCGGGFGGVWWLLDCGNER